MSSWQARCVARLVRWRVKPKLGDLTDLQRVREAFSQALPPPRGARFTPTIVGGVPGEWVEAAHGEAAMHTLLYLHGGGFVGCSPKTHRPITARLAMQGLRVFVPDYRLAPEHPYPAALDDARAVWDALCAATPPNAGARLVVAGDSAGGNLSLALMLALRAAGGRLPDAAALFSPATDMTGGSASVRENAERDAMFPGEGLARLAEAYVGDADPAQPQISPLLGDLQGLPPLLVHVGEDECLRDDALRLAHKARAAGVRVDLQVWATVPHVWQLMWPVPEARQSVQQAARFLRTALPWPVAQVEGQAVVTETLDVLVVGAGLSGIGMAAHLQRECPDQRHAVLEARQAMGGTWDLFRYPGVRSDSDMYTLGYAFKPWTRPKAIADGASIRDYIAETARERGIDQQVRYGHRVVQADWREASQSWRVEVDICLPGQAPQRRRFDTRWLLMCSGYYRYDRGHRPAWPGEAAFRGTWVHPQFWPDALDWAGQRVVVIGSGATAVTLLPEMARQAAHVTLLQRSPTYMVTLPSKDALADRLRRWLSPMAVYRAVRAKNIGLGLLLFRLARRYPERTRDRLVGLVRQQVGPGVDVQRHFVPRYQPWDQRICAVPDGDLFACLRSGQASVVTDTIERFEADGLRLASGEHLPADIVVTATGLEMSLLGGATLSLDGRAVDAAAALVYKGMMFSGVPNLVQTFGYTNASWTLKADLTADYTCRLIRQVHRRGLASATPVAEPGVRPRPFLDFSSGYVQRAIDRFPRQGDRKPWRLYQNYLLDWWLLRRGRIDDGHLRFARVPVAEAADTAAQPGHAG